DGLGGMRRFVQIKEGVMNEVHGGLNRLKGKGEKRAASRALGEALERITKGLFRKPDFSPFGPLPIGDPGGIGGAAATKSVETGGGEGKPVGMSKRGAGGKRKKSPTVKRLTPDAVVRRLKMGQAGISCCLDHFGEAGPESFSEGTIVYINRDHPLYKRECKKADAHTMHIARLLTQEISLMKDPRNPRQAFERQSKLLRDAFIED